MSELKAYVCGGWCCDKEAYPKDEADKVIEEKDEIIDELKEHIDELQKATDSAWSKVDAIYDELRHQKYKRCVAMAQWCMDAECKTEKDADFLVRWEHRWLALAEEPTWAKFLQLIHKEGK